MILESYRRLTLSILFTRILVSHYHRPCSFFFGILDLTCFPSASLISNSTISQEQYNSIISRLDNLVTQDQYFRSVETLTSRMERMNAEMQDGMLRNPAWKERTVSERRQYRTVSPYVRNTATPSPQRLLPRSSSSPTTPISGSVHSEISHLSFCWRNNKYAKRRTISDGRVR